MFTKRMAAALGIVLTAVFVTVAAAPTRSGTTTLISRCVRPLSRASDRINRERFPAAIA